MRQQGFTLIELAIVLVIIGLLAGGVLVGRDLIEAAGTRALISQIEKYRTAANTFRVKYNAMPGDISPANAAAFGFAARSGARGSGDGDGRFAICSSVSLNAPNSYAGCENVLFWRDLSQANLIPDALNTATDALATSLTAAQIPNYFPRAKGVSNSYVLINYHENNDIPLETLPGYAQNAFVVTGVSSTSAAGVIRQANTLTPIVAYNIDAKTDDGRPRTGRTMGFGAAFDSFFFYGYGLNSCINVTNVTDVINSAVYVTTNTSPLCMVLTAF